MNNDPRDTWAYWNKTNPLLNTSLVEWLKKKEKET